MVRGKDQDGTHLSAVSDHITKISKHFNCIPPMSDQTGSLRSTSPSLPVGQVFIPLQSYLMIYMEKINSHIWSGYLFVLFDPAASW